MSELPCPYCGFNCEVPSNIEEKIECPNCRSIFLYIQQSKSHGTIDYRPSPEIDDRSRQISELKAKGQITNDTRLVYLKSEADKVIAKLKLDNERLEKFNGELVKDCKGLPTRYTPSIDSFETIVQCTNGKKRVASFRDFDLRWYDVNNGNKLNVVKWLWQPRMPSDERKHNDELRHQKYKRCLAMARWCAAECDIYKLTPRTEKVELYRRWRKRWLELAEKFKEGK